MAEHFKQARCGLQLLEAAEDPAFFSQAHVVFGGTGAVGGGTILRILDFFDTMIQYHRPPPDRRPRLVVTGHTRREIRQFTTRLFGIHERQHGQKPERLEGIGFRTASGAVIELSTHSIDPSVPELRNASRHDRETRKRTAEEFLRARGLAPDAPVSDRIAVLTQAIRERGAQPFTHFLDQYRRERGVPVEGAKFQSVVVAIPLASVATYQLSDLEAFAKALGIEKESELEALKASYLEEFPTDLATVADRLAHEVLVAHTTAVEGMYDEDPSGRRTIRLGFAHSALGDKLREKQLFAETLTRLYSERGIRMLVTAAAIGIDAILHHKVPPIQGAIRGEIDRAGRHGHPVIPPADRSDGHLRVYPPVHLDVLEPGDGEIRMAKGHPMVFDHVIKSGENGYFTISNASALYRVMRVASDSELGFVLARTAVLGDDAHAPRFRNNICYYTETDYSRQVFDLLSQPQLRANELTGLQPKALQDLGSAKHQGEIHTLSLLILLHRLKTLDLSAIGAKVDLGLFDPHAYFEGHSQPLTFDDVWKWDAATLSRELTTLVTAEKESDLEAFHSLNDPYPDRQEAISRILQAVLRAVWAIPSIGTPILYTKGDRLQASVGYYAAPLDRILTHEHSLLTQLRDWFRDTEAPDQGDAFRRFREFHFANGFVDLRPQATLVTAHSHHEDLSTRVQVFDDEAALLEALKQLPPYSYFTTSGLIALQVRLKGLARYARELNFELGTANDFRAHFFHDETGRALLVPGVVEAFRMISEGLEKNTGSEPLDGLWGYGWPSPGTASS